MMSLKLCSVAWPSLQRHSCLLQTLTPQCHTWKGLSCASIGCIQLRNLYARNRIPSCNMITLSTGLTQDHFNSHTRLADQWHAVALVFRVMALPTIFVPVRNWADICANIPWMVNNQEVSVAGHSSPRCWLQMLTHWTAFELKVIILAFQFRAICAFMHLVLKIHRSLPNSQSNTVVKNTSVFIPYLRVLGAEGNNFDYDDGLCSGSSAIPTHQQNLGLGVISTVYSFSLDFPQFELPRFYSLSSGSTQLLR